MKKTLFIIGGILILITTAFNIRAVSSHVSGVSSSDIQNIEFAQSQEKGFITYTEDCIWDQYDWDPFLGIWVHHYYYGEKQLCLIDWLNLFCQETGCHQH